MIELRSVIAELESDLAAAQQQREALDVQVWYGIVWSV